jgi:hypothetical protein
MKLSFPVGETSTRIPRAIGYGDHCAGSTLRATPRRAEDVWSQTRDAKSHTDGIAFRAVPRGQTREVSPPPKRDATDFPVSRIARSPRTDSSTRFKARILLQSGPRSVEHLLAFEWKILFNACLFCIAVLLGGIVLGRAGF